MLTANKDDALLPFSPLCAIIDRALYGAIVAPENQTGRLQARMKRTKLTGDTLFRLMVQSSKILGKLPSVDFLEEHFR
jgi:hypothetical protein